MSDMTPRPRGGWQMGNVRRPLRVIDVLADQAPDCYTVLREGETFIVRHYADRTAKRPCCVVRVERKAGESDVETLARVSRHCEQKHG